MSFLHNNAEAPVARLLLAHGAGAGMRSPFMQDMAERLATQGISVSRFDFPYMQVAEQTGKRRPPDKAPKLMGAFEQAISQMPKDLPLFIGGKSMGGRMASMLMTSVDVAGCICLGYPFHPPGKPDTLRIEHLQSGSPEVCIVQGTRDTFGKQDEVSQYALAPSVQVHYIEDGDHSFKPRKASGLTLEENLQQAAQICRQYVLDTL